jgi:hypothetical protein
MRKREKRRKNEKSIGAILEVYWPHTSLRDGKPPR